MSQTKEEERRSQQSNLEWYNEEVYVIPGLRKIQEITSIPASVTAGVILILLVVLALKEDHLEEITLIIGSIYPCLKSIEALQTDTYVEDDKMWLTYWMCFGILTLLDENVESILEVLPFYHTFKLFALIWLLLPRPIMGASHIYNYILRPIYRVIQPLIRLFSQNLSEEVYIMR